MSEVQDVHLVADTRTASSESDSSRRRKRRLIERFRRLSSSPSLAKDKYVQYVPESQVLARSVSCGTLDTPGPFTVRMEPRPPSFSAAREQEFSFATAVGWRHFPILRPPRDLFRKLPDELKIKVFSYLNAKELVRAALVSKQWQALCYDGQLWSVFDATDFYKDIPVDKLANILLRAGPFVRHLNLRGCVQIQHDWRVEMVSNTCSNLLTLNFEGSKLERNVINNFLSNNSSLVQLNLAGLASVSNSTCKRLAQSCPKLESVDVSWCTGVDGRGIRRVVGACPGLRELRAAEIGRFDESATLQAIFRANSLERLCLSGCSSITDESIRILVEGKNPDIDPLTQRTTAPARKLRHLDLSQCTRLTSAALNSLAYNVPDLEGLQLAGCEALTDDGFEALFPTLSKLTHLDLEECSEITSSAIEVLARSPCAATLKHVQLSYCENVGDAGLIPLVKQCPNLVNLELDNTRVGDATLEVIAAQTRARTESNGTSRPFVGMRIVIYDCPSITWQGVREIMNRNGKRVSSRWAHGQVVQMKVYYGWQMTVDEHLKRVLRGDLCAARKLELRWSEHMVAAEEGRLGNRQNRRGRNGTVDPDDTGVMSSWRRRRRGGSCNIM